MSFYPVSGSDVAGGQTWVGLVGFYLGWGFEPAQSTWFVQAGMKVAVLGGVRAELGGDVAPVLVGWDSPRFG